MQIGVRGYRLKASGMALPIGAVQKLDQGEESREPGDAAASGPSIEGRQAEAEREETPRCQLFVPDTGAGPQVTLVAEARRHARRRSLIVNFGATSAYRGTAENFCSL